MKKMFLPAILILIAVISGQAQDRIITWKNDTIECKILSSSGRYIRFAVDQNGIQTKGRMNRAEAKNIVPGENSRQDASTGPAPGRLCIGLSGGPAFLIGDTGPGRESAAQLGMTPPQVDDYYNQITGGWQSMASVHYCLDEEIAVGLAYRFFTSKADLFVTMDPQDGVNLYHGQMVENLYVNYAGPSVLYQHALTFDGKLRFTASASLGLAFYRDESTILGSGYLMTGKALGYNSGLGIEYFVLPRLSAGIDVSAFLATLSKVKVGDGYSSTTVKLEGEDRENISSLDFSAGLKFYF